MKGIIIYEDYRGKQVVEAIKLGMVNYECKSDTSDGSWINNLSGVRKESTQARCNKDDTYDFETGALIALMKMCGVDKIVRACNEAFSEDTFKTYAIKYERELNELKKDFDKVKDLKEYYKKNYEDVREHYGKLGDRNKYLIDDINKKLEYIKEKDEEIKKLKSDKDKSWKNYQRSIQKKQDRINELNNIEEGYIKLREEYDSLFEEKEKLQHEYNLCLNSENALKYTVDSLNKSVDKLSHSIDGYKNDLYNTAKRCKELKEENEKLKLDCEKLQHGYNDMLFCGGRQNGKQYTFLVDLFKKTDQKKVDAAYKEAYDKWIAQPIWQKEVFKQIHKDQLASLLEAGKWLCKPPTKREEMWDDILKEGRTPVYVKREDIHEFLKECQATGIKWTTGKMPLETMPFHMSKGYDGIYFFVMTSLDISKSTSGSKEYRHVMCWWMTASDEEARNSIKYLPPMRWDLFKKGRIVIKVEKENYGEFCNRMFAHFDKVGVHAFNHDCKFGYFAFNKDTDYVERVLSSDCGQIKDIKHRKIVDWEDVRENKTTMEDPYDTWSL